MPATKEGRVNYKFDVCTRQTNNDNRANMLPKGEQR